MWKDFRAFVLRGNVIDLAVAVILGAAFGKIVTSLVDDILMPPLGLILGGVDFKDLFIDLSGRGYATLAEAQAAGAPTLRYGLFANAVVNFLIVALAIFLTLRWVVSRIFPAPAAAPVTRDCPFCLSAIPIQARRCAHCTAELPAA
jgi:large conductance mechanosensitive channel